MVDFQSRDTRRGVEDDEPDEEATDSESETEEAESETTEGDDEVETTAEPDDEAETGVDEAVDESSEASESQNHSAGQLDDGGSESRDDEQADHGGDGHGDNSGHHAGHDHSHDHHAHDLDTLGVAVVTVSSSRTLSDDPAGDTITAAMEADDDEVVTRELIPDEYDRIEGTLDNLVGRGDVDVIVTSGGTGVTPDDVTIEAAKRLFDKELPGFGELFRLLSYDEIGTRVVGTRATAGIVNGVPVFCLPGSENAARLGAETIISEEADHLAGLAKRPEK